MGKTSVFWVKMRAALTALVLTIVAFGPSLDQAVCAGEWSASAAAAEASADVTLVSAPLSHDHQPGNHIGEPGACAHGHCHHGAPFVALNDLAVSRLFADRNLHKLALSSPHIGDLKFGMKRPPRA